MGREIGFRLKPVSDNGSLKKDLVGIPQSIGPVMKEWVRRIFGFNSSEFLHQGQDLTWRNSVAIFSAVFGANYGSYFF